MFCQVLVFGQSAVHRFSNNVSEMKKIEGHDYENIIQVSIVYHSAHGVTNASM